MFTLSWKQVQKHQMIIRHVPRCGGTGTIRTQQRSPFGTFVNQNNNVQTVMEQEKLLKKNVHIVMGMDMSIKYNS